MGTQAKFNEQDRNKAIPKVEMHFNVRLYRVNNRKKKVFKDESGRLFIVLGGQKWHGIPGDILEEEEYKCSGGILILSDHICVYYCHLHDLIENKSRLSHNKKGDYQFHIESHGSDLRIKEIDGLYLKRLEVAKNSPESP